LENGGVGICRSLRGVAQDFGQTPIHYQNFAESTDHDVSGLEVAMQDAAGVRESDGIANPEEETQAVGERRNRFDVQVEALAFDKFHGVEDAPVGERADVVNGHDAGMLEARENASFAVEAMREVAAGNGNVKDFESYAARQRLVFRGVNDAHAASRDAFEQTVTRSREVRRIGAFAQAFEGFVREKFHGASEPKTARASRWNSSSLAQISRRRSRAMQRNSRRAHESALVTSVTGMAYS